MSGRALPATVSDRTRLHEEIESSRSILAAPQWYSQDFVCDHGLHQGKSFGREAGSTATSPKVSPNGMQSLRTSAPTTRPNGHHDSLCPSFRPSRFRPSVMAGGRAQASPRILRPMHPSRPPSRLAAAFVAAFLGSPTVANDTQVGS